MNRRDFHRLALMGASAIAGGLHYPFAWADESVDVPWRSDDPHLSGNFLPVLRETNVSNLRVTSGRIPADLRGVYMRNGPNPQFQPLSYAYPMDGDGMIHAVYLEDGRARYRNRYVQTSSLRVERRAGHALYGGFTHPVPVPPDAFLPGESHSRYKNGAFINVIQHGDHLLALSEASPCYEINEELDTLGQWKAGTNQPISLGAHNRRHPNTGDLYALQYSVETPLVHIHRIDAVGQLQDTISVELPMPTMIHDFVLTERHIILVAGPAVFDIEAARAGKPILQWRPDLGMRIAAIPLDGGAPIWVEGEPFFVYHFANGFERNGQIIIDLVHHDRFSFKAARPTLQRMTLDLAQRKFTLAKLSDLVTEFPRINHQHEALPTRYVYMPTLTASLTLPAPPPAVFNTVVKVDTETGKSTQIDLGNHIVGEPAFVPMPGGGREDDGYLAAFVYDPVRNSSSFVLLNARRLEDGPVAVVELPQRVPQGLHGNWMARN